MTVSCNEQVLVNKVPQKNSCEISLDDKTFEITPESPFSAQRVRIRKKDNLVEMKEEKRTTNAKKKDNKKEKKNNACSVMASDILCNISISRA